ncbi:hypothetical protein [Corynebacterium sp. HMSC077D03]|uniref:hypothetical protein n=1 Tax=Corynebacterium sp. HMSC077D03 TaxID=1739392 RepID=UPI00114CBDFC|nr:hypothetical protein [Corynebacterium sp. HMSC077D03]
MQQMKNSAAVTAELNKTNFAYKNTRIIATPQGLNSRPWQSCQVSPRFTGNSSTKSEFSNTVWFFGFFQTNFHHTQNENPQLPAKTLTRAGELGLCLARGLRCEILRFRRSQRCTSAKNTHRKICVFGFFRFSVVVCDV